MEFRRAAIRIASNYVRLVASVCLTLYLYRVLTGLLGDEAVGLVFLLTSTVGIVAVVEEATSWSTIRELGAAHHGGDVGIFRTMFNSALMMSAGLAVVILAVFGVVLLCLPLMDISDALMNAARWFVIAKALETVVLVLFSPQFNMYVVTERMAAYNFWLTMRRAVAVIAAVSLFGLNPGHDPASGLIVYGWVSSGLMIGMTVLSVVIISRQDRRLMPELSAASRDGLRGLLGISGWNLGIQGAQTFVLPLGSIIMNVAFGLKYNQVFGYSTTLAGYARMLASGMTVGLDAVAARISTANADASMHGLVRYSTMLHGLVVFPAVVGIGMLAHPILVLWLGSKVQVDPVGTMAESASLTRILLAGFAVMLLCDCWTRVLFGAGHVKRYAPVVIAGNLVTPLIAMLLLVVLPESVRYTAVSWAFVALYAGVLLATIPPITAKTFNMTWWQVVSPLVKPLMASLFCSPVLWWFLIGVSAWNVIWLASAALAYAAAYTLLAWYFVLEHGERTRILGVIRARWARVNVVEANPPQ